LANADARSVAAPRRNRGVVVRRRNRGVDDRRDVRLESRGSGVGRWSVVRPVALVVLSDEQVAVLGR